MKDFFEVKDFIYKSTLDYDQGQVAAAIANKKLNEIIQSWPVVYGQLPVSGFSWTGPKQWYDTHKARLAFIEEIVKEPCKHEPTIHRGLGYICKNCGVELQATWSEKK
jgi:hypothetical protein